MKSADQAVLGGASFLAPSHEGGSRRKRRRGYSKEGPAAVAAQNAHSGKEPTAQSIVDADGPVSVPAVRPALLP